MPIAQVSSTILETRTVPELIDYHLEHSPDCTFTVFPGESINDDPSRISYLEFGRATQRFARAVRPDAPVKHGETVGIIANCDSLMYITAIAGLARAGLTAFPMSPRNSSAAICHMLRKVSSHRLIVTASSLGSLLEDVKKELAASDYALDVQELPKFPDIYPHFTRETANDPFEPIKLPPRDAFVDEAVLYIHSSGSTGFPKPIPWTHKFFSKFTHAVFVEEYRGQDRDILAVAPGMPSFHMMGVAFQLLHPLYTGRPSGVFRPTYPRPPPITSPETILEALKALKPSIAFVVPSILEIWIHDHNAVEFLKTLDIIAYGGGPLSQVVGDHLVAEGCKLAPVYGGTEFSAIVRLRSSRKSPEEWGWMEFFPNITPRWIPQGDGSFELQLLANKTHSLAVENLPDVRGYSTKDLFIPHPTKEGLWRIVGRVDDVLILANGEKIVPGPTEGTLLAHPSVRGAVMFGRERNQAGLLIEPAEHHEVDPTDEAALAAYRNEIWPAVEEANRVAPAFGRVFKEMILVTSPGKPLPRAAKGTVSHKAAVSLYDEEIRALYDTVERPEKGSGVPRPESWTVPEVENWLTELAKSIQDGKEVAGGVDLFEQGFDSLSATFLRNNIISALRVSGESSAAQAVGNGFVYANPVLTGMARAIISLVNPGDGSEDANPIVAISNMIDFYSKDMSPINIEGRAKPDREVVLLTGSTGGLGSLLLAALLTNERVKKVYVLNRPSGKHTSLARHESTFEDRGLDTSLLNSPKLVFVEGDTSRNLLGLAASRYEELRTSVTIIIHNAWRLDFNLSLSSFEPNVRGTRHLIDLALTSLHAAHVRFLFTSSVSVAQSWPRGGEPFPEEPQSDARWSVGTGYGEGKYVSEQLLVKAADLGLQTASFRIGQISGGDINGAWAITDWVPIMVATSIALSALPDAQGLSSWIPFDAVSQAILDVAFGKERPELALNLVHPRPTPWHNIMEAASDNLVKSGITKDRLPLITFEQWFSRLQDASVGASDETIKRIPAIKLLDFFRSISQADTAVRVAGQTHAESGGLSSLSTSKSQRASQALRELEPLGDGDVGRWIGYWKAKDLFAK